MAWLWSTWQEYVDYVHPVVVDSKGVFDLAKRRSWFENELRLGDALRKLTTALESLAELGFKGDNNNAPPDDSSILEQANRLAIDLVHAGEMLLLYHKRLATSRASYGFLHQNDLIDHWDRYSATKRIFKEIDQLVEDTQELLSGYHEMVQTDEEFLVHNMDLPDDLEADFRKARNLFSVGFDDIGVLIAGRGLEGVLCKVAKVRKIMIEVKGKLEPAADADLYDLIEAMFRVRWKTNGTRLITSETRALLHYLRILRNGNAHFNTHGQEATLSPHETAAVIAETANQLWKNITSTRSKLDSTTIQKTW